MESQRRIDKVNVLLFITLILLIRINRGEECKGTPPTLTVEYKEKRLFSPGYPGHYNNNLDCLWLLQAQENVTAGFGIQLAVIELELHPDHEATTIDQCDNDYLEVFEGFPTSMGQPIGTWCGSDRKAVTSTNSTLTLKFHSDSHYTSKGFVVEYALVKLASAECQPGNITQIYADQAPVYVSFTVNSIENRCTWRMQAVDNTGETDSASSLVVEAFSIPKTWCQDGHFVLFDGPDLSSQVLRWCNGGEAFSKIFLSSSYAALTFEFTGKQQFQSDTIQLKLYSRRTRFQQVCSDSAMPTIHVNKNPIYFHSPVMDIRGNPCPMHVSQETEGNYLRIDVMSINGHLPMCGSDVITVKRGNMENVDKSCSRQQYPIYLAKMAATVINSTENVLLRVLSADPLCSGITVPNLATTSLLLEDTLPKGFMHVQNCISKYLITANNEHLVVALSLKWTKPQVQEGFYRDSNFCPGDFVNVYDGNDEHSPLVFSTCHKTEEPDLFVQKRIISKSNNLLVVFNSDDVADSSFVELTYYALPRNDHCLQPHEVIVTTDVQELTSPRYPDYYPLDYDCMYKLKAKNPKDNIVIEVVDAEFSRGCETVIQIYNGDTGKLETDYIGHVCGYTKERKFISDQHQAVIQFKSHQMGLVGNWRLRIFSLSKGTAQSGQCKSKLASVLLTAMSGYLVGQISLYFS